ncbi:uncharacterized protein KGF55_003290 [Candida pseudojiufengensis]|uniref:uncharacterized protein n=1 Tax=Candida pseudojiufengensis TaxID=497109 RepID=UPI0022243A2D|nr:uncharacterized protein KGF55_003290 [Candida pseudojiufengensis]KAI5962214.1 hypothetical protein KGF55_003290 [Candida pseudojiufengensis]
MSATPAKELGEQNKIDTNLNNSLSKSNILSQPKSFSDYTTPSPTDEESSKSLPPKKQSPSNSELLSDLKKFNVDQTIYKHYGHQSSMNSQSLNKIIHINSPNEEEVETKKDEESITNNKSPEKLEIENKLAQMFGISSNLTKDRINWPYNAETLNDLVRLQIEQEKTKQNQLKKDMGEILIKLLSLTKDSNINIDLLPFLFVSDSVNSNTLIERIDRLKNNDPNLIVKDIVERSKSLDNNTTTNLSSSNNQPSGIKRKHSDTQLPSFSETTQNIKTSSALVSPLRSPVNKSPVQSHRRIVSDSSDVSIKSLVSKGISPSNNPPQLPLPNSNLSRPQFPQHQPFLHQPQTQPQSQLQPPIPATLQGSSRTQSQTHSQQHSPTIPYQAPQQSYQYYYPTQLPQASIHSQPQSQPQPIPQPPVFQAQHLPQPPPPHQQQQQQPISTQSNTGSPYPQKFHASTTSNYPNVAYPNYNQSISHYAYYQPKSPDHTQAYQPSEPQMIPQHHHQPVPPKPSTVSTKQQQQHQQQQPIPVPTHQFETSPDRKTTSKSSNHNNEENPSTTSTTLTPPMKRSKHSKNNNHGGINFMITTPSNPPARKYNNPK